MSIECSIKNAYGTALAVLNRKFGDLHLAEDAMQHACLKATEHWAAQVPDNPKAWLIKVASHFAIDQLRKVAKEEPLESTEEANSKDQARVFEDAVLGMIFTCCHPSISEVNQLALTLKLVMGFDDMTIARALLIPVKTLEQRITRTKRKIKSNQLNFDLPAEKHLAMRLPAVLRIIYLIFNEGHHHAIGDKLSSNILCQQAISLTQSISRVYRGHSHIYALLALMMFTHARSSAREPQTFISLEDQDRSRWNKSLIAQADVLLQKAIKLGRVNHYHVEAAISGLHCLAPSYQETDWQQINLLYDKLLTYQYSPVAIVNQAFVYMQLEQWQIAEQKLLNIKDSMQHYTPYYLALAFLYESTEREEKAIKNYDLAIRLTKNNLEKTIIQEKQNKLSRNK